MNRVNFIVLAGTVVSAAWPRSNVSGFGCPISGGLIARCGYAVLPTRLGDVRPGRLSGSDATPVIKKLLRYVKRSKPWAHLSTNEISTLSDIVGTIWAYGTGVAANARSSFSERVSLVKLRNNVGVVEVLA